jgi:hypothetical protein
MIRLSLFTMLGWLAMGSAARAHKLEVSYTLVPGRLLVLVHGYYEVGDPASGARVKIVQTDGRTIREGRLDKHGFFTFAITDAEELKIVVSLAGHRANKTIAAETLRRHILAYCSACLAALPMQTAALLDLRDSTTSNESARAAAGSDVPSNFPWTGLLIGVGVLSVTAIVFHLLSKRKAA